MPTNDPREDKPPADDDGSLAYQCANPACEARYYGADAARDCCGSDGRNR